MNSAPQIPKLERARIGIFSSYFAAGYPIAEINGIAIKVPSAVAKPSSYQSNGASVCKFHRTKPYGTEYITAHVASAAHSESSLPFSIAFSSVVGGMIKSSSPGATMNPSSSLSSSPV